MMIEHGILTRCKVIAAVMAAVLPAWPALSAAGGDEAATVAAAADGTVPDAAQVLRDPFWPVGYTPPPPVVKTADGKTPPAPPPRRPPDWNAAASMLKYQGTFTGRDRDMASVNGQIVEVGSIIGVRIHPWIYQWRVTAIHRHGVETAQHKVTPIAERR